MCHFPFKYVSFCENWFDAKYLLFTNNLFNLSTPHEPMPINFELEGRAALVHTHDPANFRTVTDTHLARIEPSQGSMGALTYELPLTKEQYDELMAQVTSPDFRQDVCEAEGYKVPPHIQVKCAVTLTPRKGE